LTFKALEASPTKKSKTDDEQMHVDGGSENTTIVVQPYAIPNRGPYPLSEPRRNTIRFTPTQVEAIKSGMQPGLTMVGDGCAFRTFTRKYELSFANAHSFVEGADESGESRLHRIDGRLATMMLMKCVFRTLVHSFACAQDARASV
jgi:hypothetical protein